MARTTVRLDLSHDELLTLAWSVWFAAPAARAGDRDTIDQLHSKLLAKRRQLLEPGPDNILRAADDLTVEP